MAKAKVLLKATYLTMPMAVAMTMLGILFYNWSLALKLFLLATFVALAITLLKIKQYHWLYYAAVIYVGLLSFVFLLFKLDI